MSLTPIKCGFLPLVDCVPLVIARELGFAEEEGLDLQLSKEPSWSVIRDKLVFGAIDAAQTLSVMPVAMSLGLGGAPTRVDALSVLSVNGDVIGVSPDLADKMRRVSPDASPDPATAVGLRLIAASEDSLRIGVPFPFSMHAELLRYWLGALRIGADVLDIRTVPPPQMGQAVAEGEIDAFCVGEPWGSLAVEARSAELILPGSAVWRFSPEKTLSARHDWVEAEGETAAAVIRAHWRAAKWLSDKENLDAASQILGGREFLNIAPEQIDRVLNGRLIMSPGGRETEIEDLVIFHDRAATFPWRSQGVWIATRWAARMGLNREEAAEIGRACFRSDLYRAALAPLGVDLPGSSEKLEGALDELTPVASSRGEMFLGPDRFFDGRVFDPVDQQLK